MVITTQQAVTVCTVQLSCAWYASDASGKQLTAVSRCASAAAHSVAACERKAVLACVVIVNEGDRPRGPVASKPWHAALMIDQAPVL